MFSSVDKDTRHIQVVVHGDGGVRGTGRCPTFDLYGPGELHIDRLQVYTHRNYSRRTAELTNSWIGSRKGGRLRHEKGKLGMVGDNHPDRYCRDLCSGVLQGNTRVHLKKRLQPNGFARIAFGHLTNLEAQLKAELARLAASLDVYAKRDEVVRSLDAIENELAKVSEAVKHVQ